MPLIHFRNIIWSKITVLEIRPHALIFSLEFVLYGDLIS